MQGCTLHLKQKGISHKKKVKGAGATPPYKSNSMKAAEENLNLANMRKRFALAALNKAPTSTEAAILLGVDERTLRHWKNRYKIRICPTTKVYAAQ